MNKIKFQSVNEWISFFDDFTLEKIGAKKLNLRDETSTMDHYYLKNDGKEYMIYVQNKIATDININNNLTKAIDANLNCASCICRLLDTLYLIHMDDKYLNKAKIELELIGIAPVQN